MERTSRIMNVLSQHKELQWLMSSIIICTVGLFGILIATFVWYL